MCDGLLFNNEPRMNWDSYAIHPHGAGSICNQSSSAALKTRAGGQGKGSPNITSQRKTSVVPENTLRNALSDHLSLSRAAMDLAIMSSKMLRSISANFLM